MNTLHKQAKKLPKKPGCYLFLGKNGVVLYVGKAKNLQKRVLQYFGQDKRPQLPFLVQEAVDLDFFVANSELEALYLESTLIQKHNPKYNIKLKDDKSFAFITIDYSTPIPQIGYSRKNEGQSSINSSSSSVIPKEVGIHEKLVNFQATGERRQDMDPVSWHGMTEDDTKKTKSDSSPRPLTASSEQSNRKLGRNNESVSLSTNSPQLQTTNYKPKTTNYFGPYSSTKKIRDTLELIRKIFHFCANTEVSNRPCFYFHLHRCPGVCVGEMSLSEYATHLERIKLFLNGKTADVKKDLRKAMMKSAQEKKFEIAGRLRDQLKALEILSERQLAQFPQKYNYDLVSLFFVNNQTCVNLFKVREGKLIDKENFLFVISASNAWLSNTLNYETRDSRGICPDGHLACHWTDGQISKGSTESKSLAIEFRNSRSNSPVSPDKNNQSTILQAFLERYYSTTSDFPSTIFTETPAQDTKLIEALLASRAYKKIPLKTAQRGKIAKLLKLGKVNAEEYLRKNAQADESTNLKTALLELQQVLNLPTIPNRIECYDISNTQGTNPVGSMVVFVGGKPAKSEYRKFKIRSKNSPDDFAMMEEMLTRRLARSFLPLSVTPSSSVMPISPSVIPTEVGIHEKLDDLKVTGKRKQNIDSGLPAPRRGVGVVETGPPAEALAKEGMTAERPWPLPDLVVIDGGKGQLNVALKATKFEILNSKSQTNSKHQTQNQNHTLKTTNNKLQTLPMIGLAKRIEEIFVPNKSKPIILNSDTEALKLLQRLRDEAHRFAITFHRSLRSKQAVKSELDTIKGIGPKTKKLLKEKFGTLTQIKSAKLEELAEVVGEGKANILENNLMQ